MSQPVRSILSIFGILENRLLKLVILGEKLTPLKSRVVALEFLAALITASKTSRVIFLVPLIFTLCNLVSAKANITFVLASGANLVLLKSTFSKLFAP